MLSRYELAVKLKAMGEDHLREMPLGSVQRIAQLLGTSGRGTKDELIPAIMRRINAEAKEWR